MNYACLEDDEIDENQAYSVEIIDPLRSGISFLNSVHLFRGSPSVIDGYEPIFDPVSMTEEDDLTSLEVLDECRLLAGDDLDEKTVLRLMAFAKPAELDFQFVGALGMFTIYLLELSMPARLKALRRWRSRHV